MNRTAAAALPTEPLLDESGDQLATASTDAATRQWLQDLSRELELPARCGTLYEKLRKSLGSDQFEALGRGILALSSAGDPAGIAALSAFVSVRAPGERLVQRVESFTSLRRQLSLVRRRREAGNPLGPGEKELLATLQSLHRDFAERLADEADAGSPSTPDEIGVLRQAFGVLVAELEATQTLVSSHLDDFLRLARAELDAREMRAAALAEAIDPYAARQISRIMPVLGQVDSELHDLRHFVAEVEEQRRAVLLLERRPRGHEHLETREWQRLRNALGESAGAQLLHRIFLGVERNPLPERTLAYFTDRLIAATARLAEAKLRRRPLDVPTAVAHVLDFHRDGVTVFPASARVLEALAEQPPEGLDLLEGRLRIVFEPVEARRLALPYGLPVPLGQRSAEEIDPDAEPSVKDLVLDNIMKTSVLLGLLKNEKVINTPGVVALVVQRSRNMRILDVVAQTRKLHSGFANKDVPLALLRSPSNIPIKTLRKFINVRYVGKVDLRRLARDRSSVRREVADEIDQYLTTLN